MFDLIPTKYNFTLHVLEKLCIRCLFRNLFECACCFSLTSVSVSTKLLLIFDFSVWTVHSTEQIQPCAHWRRMTGLAAVGVSNRLAALSLLTCVTCSYFLSHPSQIVVVLVIDFPFFYFRSPLRCHRSALSITQWRWAYPMPSWWSTRSNRFPVSLKMTATYSGVSQANTFILQLQLSPQLRPPLRTRL